MEVNQEKSNPFENFTGREVHIILDKHLFSSTYTISGVNYIKGRIIKVYPRFILVRHKKKEILINIDNILGIEN